MLRPFLSKTVLAILQAVLLLLPASLSHATAQLQGVFENPVDGAVESGIGVIAGWHCTANQITIAIDGVSIGRAGSGTVRQGTRDICGHTETGFSLLYNWNKLPPGQHTVTMYADGVEFDSKVITTTQSAGAEYVRGLQKTVTVPDFPSAGRTATLEWREATQAFVVTRSDSQTTASRTSAEGFWVGTSSPYAVHLAILENGETWGVYYANNTIYGALYGQTSTSGTTLSGNGIDFYIPRLSVTSGSYNGTFVPMQTIRLSSSLGGIFSGNYSSEYDKAASVASIAGSYAGSGVTGSTPSQSVVVTVSSNGRVSASSGGCNISGTITPRASGKNVFNVSTTFSGSCALTSGTTTIGVGYYDASVRQILVMALTRNKNDGFIYIGTKR
jgi:hypothetical protein